jgi:hypothetical protein
MIFMRDELLLAASITVMGQRSSFLPFDGRPPFMIRADLSPRAGG